MLIKTKKAALMKIRFLKKIEKQIKDELRLLELICSLTEDFTELVESCNLYGSLLTVDAIQKFSNLNHELVSQIDDDIYIRDLNLYQLNETLKKLDEIDKAEQYRNLIINDYYSDKWYLNDPDYVDFETQMKTKGSNC
jgi:hypothetical protein